MASPIVAEAIGMLKSGMASTERRVRLDTAKRLDVVAKAIGAAAVQKELLDEVMGFTDDEDEVLCVIAEKLNGSFVQSFANDSAGRVKTLTILKKLASATETVVRQRAVVSMAEIMALCDVVNDAGSGLGDDWEFLRSTVMELSCLEEGTDSKGQTTEHWFPAKVSVAHLYEPLYRKLGRVGEGESTPGSSAFESEKRQLMEAFTALTEDDMPVVRNSAATALAGLASVADDDHLRKHVISMLKVVLADRSDVVRDIGARTLGKLMATLAVRCGAPQPDAPKLPLPPLKGEKEATAAAIADIITEVFELYEAALRDASWRVRLGCLDGVVDALKLTVASSGPSTPATNSASASANAVPPPGDSTAAATPKEEGAAAEAPDESTAAAGKDGEESGATNRVSVLLGVFAELLEDTECEVRLGAAKTTVKMYSACANNGDSNGEPDPAMTEAFQDLVMPTILQILSEALDDPTLMPGGGMLDSRAGLLRKTQALMCMELAGFDAVPHEMLVDIVHSLLASEPSLCVDVLASFRLLGKIKDTDPKTLTQVCADALTLGKHEDWRCRVAFLGNLDFIFEQLTDADPELLKETTVMEAVHVATTEKLSAPTQGNPDVWEAFKGVVDAAMWDEVAEARIQFVAKLPSLVRWTESSFGVVGVTHIVTMLLSQYDAPARDSKTTGAESEDGASARFTSYLYKINVITAVQSIVTMAPPPAYLTEDETRLTDLLELVCKAAVHTTPNVRLIAANALGAIGKSASEGLWAADRAAQVEMQIRPLLVEMSQNDVDVDAMDSAKKALTNLPEEEG